MDVVVQQFQHMPPLLAYIVLAVFLLLESSGIPLLNTTLLLCTGAMAALGHLSLGILLLAAIGGSTLGACTAYGLGRFCGEPFLLWIVRFLRINERRVMLIEKRFQHSGARMIFLSRIVPYIRPFACFPAGISAMPFRSFFLAAFFGSVIWCTAFLLVGWSLGGPRGRFVLRLLHFYGMPALFVLVPALLLVLFCKYAFARSIKKRLEASDRGSVKE